MHELSNHTEFLIPSHPPGHIYPQAEDLIAAMERALARVASMPIGVSPAAVRLARRTLVALRCGESAPSDEEPAYGDLPAIDDRFHGLDLEEITARVAQAFHLSPEVLKSPSRITRVAFCRQVAMYLCRKLTNDSFPTIGAHFGRDHSTTIHACRVIEQRVALESGFDEFIVKLESEIRYLDRVASERIEKIASAEVAA